MRRHGGPRRRPSCSYCRRGLDNVWAITLWHPYGPSLLRVLALSRGRDWTQWRHVRHSIYNLEGKLFAHLPRGRFLETYDATRALEDACPAAKFTFSDYDGEKLEATTRIEEREWLFGTGWFKWLSLFRRPKIRRSLDIRFSGETGKRKGSWKGGTIGTGINMLPGELHEAAFRRYCAESSMTFLASADTRPEGGDSTEIAAPFTSGAVPKADAQTLPSGDQ